MVHLTPNEGCPTSLLLQSQAQMMKTTEGPAPFLPFHKAALIYSSGLTSWKKAESSLAHIQGLLLENQFPQTRDKLYHSLSQLVTTNIFTS